MLKMVIFTFMLHILFRKYQMTLQLNSLNLLYLHVLKDSIEMDLR
jgi:hypothetical protein